MNSAKRHAYFVKMLRGFETDLFALEVGKLCLMLADFPNANGWQLENRDVFTSRSFTDSLKDARFVVCNPPYEEFTAEERGRYAKVRASEKPAELLLRVLNTPTPRRILDSCCRGSSPMVAAIEKFERCLPADSKISKTLPFLTKSFTSLKQSRRSYWPDRRTTLETLRR
jgi:hypothetical protein